MTFSPDASKMRSWIVPAFVLTVLSTGSVAFLPPPTATSSRITASSLLWENISPCRIRPARPLYVVTDREPDLVEMLLGGERYEMVPLPDRMCDTTIFVGNLDEFVHDQDLSQLFQTVSVLQSVPACVVRKANMQSLRYGFVSFPTVEEKEVSGETI